MKVVHLSHLLLTKPDLIHNIPGALCTHCLPPATRPTSLTSHFKRSRRKQPAMSIIFLTRLLKVTLTLTTLQPAWQQTTANCRALYLSEHK